MRDLQLHWPCVLRSGGFYLIPREKAVGPDAWETLGFLLPTDGGGGARGAAWASPVLSGFGPISVSTKMRSPSPQRTRGLGST